MIYDSPNTLKESKANKIRSDLLKNVLRLYKDSQNLDLDWYLERDLAGNLKYELQGAYSFLNPERIVTPAYSIK